MREMTVYGVSFDLVGKQPIVLLKTQDGNKFLPVWIGHPEAAAILMKLQGSEPQRPMTHDLLAAMSASLDAEIREVTVTELRENTFHAPSPCVRNGNEIEVDSRTSDAIALALAHGREDLRRGRRDRGVGRRVRRRRGGGISATDRRHRPLADLDPDEFRRFLDTVYAGRVRGGAEEAEDRRGGRRAPRHDGRGARPGPVACSSSAFVSARSSSTSRSSPFAESGPPFAAASASRTAARGPGRPYRAGARALSSQSSVTSRSRWFTAPTMARRSRRSPPGSRRFVAHDPHRHRRDQRRRIEDRVHHHGRVDATRFQPDQPRIPKMRQHREPDDEPVGQPEGNAARGHRRPGQTTAEKPDSRTRERPAPRRTGATSATTTALATNGTGGCGCQLSGTRPCSSARVEKRAERRGDAAMIRRAPTGPARRATERRRCPECEHLRDRGRGRAPG